MFDKVDKCLRCLEVKSGSWSASLTHPEVRVCFICHSEEHFLLAVGPSNWDEEDKQRQERLAVRH